MHADPTNWEEFLDQFPHGLLVIKGDQIMHVVGYPQPATEQDSQALAQELNSYGVLELMDLTDYHITLVSGREWRQYMQIFVGASW